MIVVSSSENKDSVYEKTLSVADADTSNFINLSIGIFRFHQLKQGIGSFAGLFDCSSFVPSSKTELDISIR